MRQISPLTLFEMFKTEMLKWPQESICFEDQPHRGGGTLRTIRLIETQQKIAQIVLDQNNSLIGIHYLEFRLQ